MLSALLLPELRELLERKAYDILIDFCISVGPGTAAEFLEALSLDELMKILTILQPHLRAEILRHLNQEIRVGLFARLKEPGFDNLHHINDLQ